MADWSVAIPDAPFDWEMIPLDGKKRPIDPETGDLMKQWQQKPGYDIESISRLNGLVKAVGLKLGPPSGGVLAVDFDGPAAPGKFEEVFNRHPRELDKTVGVTSGKHKRGQLLFQVDQDWWAHLKGRRAWTDEEGETCLELRWVGHQSVIAGAHPETDGYRWLSSPSDREVAPAPDWLLEPLLQTEEELIPFEPTSADADRAVEMLKFIDPNDNTDYFRWLKVGIALQHTDAGLLSAWVEWSKQMPNFNEAECLRKWAGFSTKSVSKLTIRSLHHWAKPAGYKQPKAKPQGGAEGDEEITSAGEFLDISERLAEGRKLFSIHGLLPQDLADAVELLQRPLPTDDLSAVMAVITGYSGLMKLGTRVASSINFSVPANLFAAMDALRWCKDQHQKNVG